MQLLSNVAWGSAMAWRRDVSRSRVRCSNGNGDVTPGGVKRCRAMALLDYCGIMEMRDISFPFAWLGGYSAAYPVTGRKTMIAQPPGLNKIMEVA